MQGRAENRAVELWLPWLATLNRIAEWSNKLGKEPQVTEGPSTVSDGLLFCAIMSQSCSKMISLTHLTIAEDYLGSSFPPLSPDLTLFLSWSVFCPRTLSHLTEGSSCLLSFCRQWPSLADVKISMIDILYNPVIRLLKEINFSALFSFTPLVHYV